MTSNVGSEFIQQLSESGGVDVEIEMKVREQLKMHFRPEFLNRIDETIVFSRLTQDDLRQIAEIQLGHLHRRLAERNIKIALTDAAKDRLATDGYDPVYGARPLKRLIQQQIENPLAKQILSGQIADGDVVSVDVAGEGYSFAKPVEVLKGQLAD